MSPLVSGVVLIGVLGDLLMLYMSYSIVHLKMYSEKRKKYVL